MKFFDNIKMKQKLLLSFSLIALFIIIVGLIGSINMNRLNLASNQII